MRTIILLIILSISLTLKANPYPKVFVDWCYATPDTIGFKYTAEDSLYRDFGWVVPVYHNSKNFKYWYDSDSLWIHHILIEKRKASYSGKRVKIDEYVDCKPILRIRSIDDYNYKKWLKWGSK